MLKRTSVLIVMAVLLAAETRTPAQGSKGKVTPPPPAPGVCQVTLRDAPGDVILSDGGGTYVNGVDGFGCNVNSDPTTVHYGWLEMSFPGSKNQPSKRFIRYPGQALDADGRTGYSGFDSRGGFEVKGMALITWNGNPYYYDVAPLRATVEIGQFFGDSNFTGGDSGGSSSVFVRPLDDGCTWYVWSDPNAGALPPGFLGDSAGTRYNPRVIWLRKQKGVNWITLGYYAMPFAATVKIIGKSGCTP